MLHPNAAKPALTSSLPVIGLLVLACGCPYQTLARGDDAAIPRQHYLQTCSKAWVATRKALQSGKGSGIYEASIDGKTRIEAGFTTVFDQNTYRVDLNYSKSNEIFDDPRKSATKKSIIGEDDVLVDLTEFDGPQGGQLRHGGIGHRYALSGSYRGAAPAGFRFNPIIPISMVTQHMIESDKIIDAKELRNGDLVFRYQKTPPGIYLEFTAGKSCGYNIISCTAFRGQAYEEPAQTETISWEKKGNVWFVQEITWSLVVRPTGKPFYKSAYRMAYTSFEINPHVSKDSFTLGSLGFREGTRILDMRPGPARSTTYNKALEGKTPKQAFPQAE